MYLLIHSEFSLYTMYLTPFYQVEHKTKYSNLYSSLIAYYIDVDVDFSNNSIYLPLSACLEND